MNTEKKFPLLPKLPPNTLDVDGGGPRGCCCCCCCCWPLNPAAGLGLLWKRGCCGGSPLNDWKGCAENCVEPGVRGGARTGAWPWPWPGLFCWLKLKKEVEGAPPPEGSCTTLLLTCVGPPNWGWGWGRWGWGWGRWGGGCGRWGWG